MGSIKTGRRHVVALTLAAASAIAVISGTLAFALTFENENPLAEARERAEETAIARGRAQLGDPLPGEAARMARLRPGREDHSRLSEFAI